MHQVHMKPVNLEVKPRMSESITLTISKEDAKSLCEAINSSSLPIKRDLGSVLSKIESAL